MRNETAADFSGFPHGGGGWIDCLGLDQHSFRTGRIVFLILFFPVAKPQ
jgi:hypothetical protein